jgi:dihydrofolate reductase
MYKVIVYIAASLDGYIARKDDDVSWLDLYQVAGEDYGYSEFMKTVGTAIMGSRTYDQSVRHPERILTNIKTYVLSRKTMPVPSGASVEFYNGNLRGEHCNRPRWNPHGTHDIGGFVSHWPTTPAYMCQ